MKAVKLLSRSQHITIWGLLMVLPLFHMGLYWLYLQLPCPANDGTNAAHMLGMGPVFLTLFYYMLGMFLWFITAQALAVNYHEQGNETAYKLMRRIMTWQQYFVGIIVVALVVQFWQL